jgi:hypothetical protein
MRCYGAQHGKVSAPRVPPPARLRKIFRRRCGAGSAVCVWCEINLKAEMNVRLRARGQVGRVKAYVMVIVCF